MTHPNREELAGALDAVDYEDGDWPLVRFNGRMVHIDNLLREAAAALRQSPTVEEVARVIDPDIFADLEAVKAAGGPWGQYGYSGQARIDAALAKAQAIASLYRGEG